MYMCVYVRDTGDSVRFEALLYYEMVLSQREAGWSHVAHVPASALKGFSLSEG